MRKIIGLIAVGLVLSVAGANAQETSRRALAEELLNLMNMQENVGKTFAMIKQMATAQIKHQTNTPANVSSPTDKMMDMMAQEFTWEKIQDDYIALYAEIFTEDEMRGIITFYKSPAGQAFLKKQPALMKGFMELSQKMMIKMTPKIEALTKELTETPPASSQQPPPPAPTH